MSRKRRKEIKRHLIKDELDKKLAEADDDEIVRRLTFLKNRLPGRSDQEGSQSSGTV